MAEDRDQLFEKALLRHLRADAPGQSLCLDPEALAAYYERLLSPEETAAAKSHLASCARCREILAQLETTHQTSEHGEEPEIVSLDAARPATPGRVTSIARAKPFTLGLVVPAGAVAAGLLLWIGVTVLRTHPKPIAAPAEVAVNRSELPATRQSSEVLKVPEAAKSELETQKTLDRLTSRSPAPGGNKDAPLSGNLASASEPGNLAQYSPRAAVPPAPARKAPVEAPVPAEPRGLAADSNALSATRSANGRTGATVEAASEAAIRDAAQTPAEAAKSGAARYDEQASKPAPAPIPAPSPTHHSAAAPTAKKNATAGTVDPAVFNAVATGAELDIRIPAPGGHKIWSVGPYGQIFYSKDGGRTWMAQFAGVSESLTGGFAPSDEVCWVAGVAGTLLRTTDGGRHWQRVATPIAGDLGGVRAADAQHASIWDAENHRSYETADGGASWKPTANE